MTLARDRGFGEVVISGNASIGTYSVRQEGPARSIRRANAVPPRRLPLKPEGPLRTNGSSKRFIRTLLEAAYRRQAGFFSQWCHLFGDPGPPERVGAVRRKPR